MDKLRISIPMMSVQTITEYDGRTYIWLDDQRIDLTCCVIWIDGDTQTVIVES